MQKIKNLIFDLGGVLLDIDYNLTRAAFESLGVAHFDEMYSQVSADKLFQKLETGIISEEDFYQQLNNSSDLNLSPEEIKKAWNAMLLTFREESLHYLEKLKPKYKIFLLSNTNQIHLTSFMETFNPKKRSKTFESYFERVFYSFKIGRRKPDKDCYDWVLEELKINPSETLFIDDSINNIEGAKKSGLQTLLLTPEMRIENLAL